MENTIEGVQQAAVQPVQSDMAQTAAAGVQMMAPPAQAPAPLYPQYLAHQQPVMPISQEVPSPVTDAINAAAMGMVIVSTGALGANLHRVNDGKMSMGEAVADSVGKGAVGAVTTAGATYAASALTTGGLLGLAVTLAAGTGISYLLSK